MRDGRNIFSTFYNFTCNSTILENCNCIRTAKVIESVPVNKPYNKKQDCHETIRQDMFVICRLLLQALSLFALLTWIVRHLLFLSQVQPPYLQDIQRIRSPDFEIWFSNSYGSETFISLSIRKQKYFYWILYYNGSLSLSTTRSLS